MSTQNPFLQFLNSHSGDEDTTESERKFSVQERVKQCKCGRGCKTLIESMRRLYDSGEKNILIRYLMGIKIDEEYDAFECIKGLVDLGIDPSSKTRKGMVPLTIACGPLGCSGVLELFFTKIEDLDTSVVDENGLTPVNSAINCSDGKALRMLIDYGSDIDTKYRDMTPLEFARHEVEEWIGSGFGSREEIEGCTQPLVDMLEKEHARRRKVVAEMSLQQRYWVSARRAGIRLEKILPPVVVRKNMAWEKKHKWALKSGLI